MHPGRWLSVSMLSLALPLGMARAESSLLVGKTGSAVANTAAVCIVAGPNETASLVVDRLRMTLSSSSAVSIVFVSKRTGDHVGDTENVSSCALPGCRTLYYLEGVMRGRVFNAADLDIELEPGHRLYYYSSASLSSEYHTLEAYYHLK